MQKKTASAIEVLLEPVFFRAPPQAGARMENDIEGDIPLQIGIVG